MLMTEEVRRQALGLQTDYFNSVGDLYTEGDFR